MWVAPKEPMEWNGIIHGTPFLMVSARGDSSPLCSLRSVLLSRFLALASLSFIEFALNFYGCVWGHLGRGFGHGHGRGEHHD